FSRDWSSDVCSSDLAEPRSAGECATAVRAEGHGQYTGLVRQHATESVDLPRTKGQVQPKGVIEAAGFRALFAIQVGFRNAGELRSEERRVGKGCGAW